MKVVFVYSTDDNTPSGGAKQAYRHIDVLNHLGIDATFIHPTKGFRYNWFDNQTRIAHIDDVELTADDFLIYGELVPEIPRVKGWDRCGKVILCQNDYNSLAGFKLDLMSVRSHYREAAAVLCPSAHAEANLKFMFKSSRVMRFRYSFDSPLWQYTSQKDKLVAVMPRKRGTEINAIVAVTGLLWMPPGWNLGRIDGFSERDVAAAYSRSGVFLSLGEREGFGMPPAEAMACGCVVVGYTGFAGDEFMLPGISFPVPDGDFIGLTRELVEVFKMSPEERAEIGLKASTFIRSTYSTQAEVASIKMAWEKITRPRIEIQTETRDRMKNEVAVYMPVYNEGPYLETLLKWLVPRVGAIFVAESIVPWSPNAKPGGESKAVVDKVLAECPDAKEVIRYLPVGSGDINDDPLIREAKQRNEVLGKIKESGFKFVWMVEADEFYRNEEVEALWDWFFERSTEGARAANCHWKTYWRSIHWRMESVETFRPNVAFLSDCKFSRGRVLSDADEITAVEVPDRICIIRHYSWARTPADTKNKLAAWGHSQELQPDWYEKVFLPWMPDIQSYNLHPTRPESYKMVVRCDLPVPEAMEGHPFNGKDLITDERGMVCFNPEAKGTVMVTDDRKRKCRIKAVIMHHNKPENADRLYEQLAPVFDDVEIFDNGSEPSQIPIHTTRSRENVYWTGTWNEVMKTCSEYDAVWVLGCDIVLLSHPKEYREAIESSLPFGCWSPCIDGRAHPFMLAEHYTDKKPREVRNVEGMALAVSGSLMRQVGELVPGSKIGFGHDFWLCYRARKAGLNNIIDGRVVVHHPVGMGYNEAEAHQQMDETFSRMYGSDYRRSIFEYDYRFEGNLMGGKIMEDGNGKRFTIVTVDNGWGLTEFVRIASKMTGARLIVMRKGIIEGTPVSGVEFIPYDPSLSQLISEADVAFFPRVGAANKEDYLNLLKAGVPMVVRESCSQNVINHQKNGWLFRDEPWAAHWLAYLHDNPPKTTRLSGVQAKIEMPEVKRPRVTVITPTYHRDLKVIHRCIDCMLLQTEKDWEQVVCSDGDCEQEVEWMVKSIGDPRIRYCHTVGKMDKDYGNTVRSEMLAQATGDFVFFFDDDNIILPNYLERMLAVLTFGDGADYAVCKIMHFGPVNEKEIGKAPLVLTGDPVRLYHIDPLQVVVRREVMQKVGWDTKVGYLSDGVSLERLAPYRIVRVDEVLGIHV